MARILITGATDGIGLETARRLVGEGHELLLHGRNAGKLAAVAEELPGVQSFVADLSDFEAVKAFAQAVLNHGQPLDVLINNAGIYKTNAPITEDGLDVRFVVNTLAPYLLTRALLPLLGDKGRVVNLSSAAQAPVNVAALAGQTHVGDMEAYAQSKLAITMWSMEMAAEAGAPMVVAVNPGSLLASKMVKEGFGVAGNDLSIGVDILHRAALSDEFADASGKYFDNDAGRFGPPHPDAMDAGKRAAVMAEMEKILSRF